MTKPMSAEETSREERARQYLSDTLMLNGQQYRGHEFPKVLADFARQECERQAREIVEEMRRRASKWHHASPESATGEFLTEEASRLEEKYGGKR